MLFSLLCLLFTVGAICWMLGIKPLAKQLIWGAIAVAIVLPIALCWIACLWSSVNVNKTYLIAIAATVLLAAVFVGWLRYVGHRRSVVRWWSVDARPVSKKRRLEESI